ncbi:MAG: DUF29 family protein [Rhodopila sp.]
MQDSLYESDILSWSQRQAELLRHLAHGERVNDIDWEHVVEEIEDVGMSELHAVESFLNLMLVHLLRVHGWPLSSAAQHWRGELSPSRRMLADALPNRCGSGWTWQSFTPTPRSSLMACRMTA